MDFSLQSCIPLSFIRGFGHNIMQTFFYQKASAAPSVANFKIKRLLQHGILQN